MLQKRALEPWCTCNTVFTVSRQSGIPTSFHGYDFGSFSVAAQMHFLKGSLTATLQVATDTVYWGLINCAGLVCSSLEILSVTVYYITKVALDLGPQSHLFMMKIGKRSKTKQWQIYEREGLSSVLILCAKTPFSCIYRFYSIDWSLGKNRFLASSLRIPHLSQPAPYKLVCV